MPVPACFHLADRVFPRVRTHAARRLGQEGWSQGRIAEALGVSQAMVSKYQARDDVEDDPLVLRLSEELLGELERPTTGTSPWCSTLSEAQADDGTHAALADLLSAERRLLEAAPLAVMPQVGLNLARCLPDPQGPADVFAYPARIVAAGDHLVRPTAPALGASNHLAGVLMILRRRDPGLHAIANIVGSPAAARAARVQARLDGDGDRLRLLRAALSQTTGPVDTVHDPGAVGIEPCLYIAGRDAVDVVERILKIHAKVKP